jgi:hypothetical protein
MDRTLYVYPAFDSVLPFSLADRISRRTISGCNAVPLWTKPSTLIGDRCGCRCVAH